MTKAQVIALIDQYITTNGNEEITGAQTNSVMKALANQDLPFADIINKPTTLSGYGITDAYTKSASDGRYVNVTGDTMSGALTVNNAINANVGVFFGGGNAITIRGTGTGISNTAYMSFYESNGTTRQGYVGFTSASNSIMYMRNDVFGSDIRLDSNGVNGFKFNDGASTRTVYHSGNLTLSTLGGEPAFSKNTAFNKNFGTSAGTVLEGDAAYTKIVSDGRYVNVTGDTMTGNLIGTGTNPFIINGTGVGDSNIAYVPFYESNGTTRQGYVGFPSSSSSDLIVRNDVSNKGLTLETGGQLSYNGPATFTGNVTATSFSGSIDASNIDSGKLADTRLQVSNVTQFNNAINPEKVNGIRLWDGTQAQYDAISNKRNDTLYFITL